MEKLFLLLKSKRNLKRQLLLLVLAATAMIAVGCTPSETPISDDTESGFEDVIDSNDYVAEEAMTPINVENLDAEAEILTNLLTEKGIDVGFEDVRATLLHLNKDSFTDDEYFSLFEETNDPEQEPAINYVFQEITGHNVHCVHSGDLSGLIDLKVFCRDAGSYKLIKGLNQYSSSIAKIVIDNPKNLDSKIKENLDPFNALLTDNKQVKIDNEIFSLEDLDDGSKALILQTGMLTYNYVNNVCQSEYLTDDTKAYCDDITDLCSILCDDSYTRILNISLFKAEHFETALK